MDKSSPQQTGRLPFNCLSLDLEIGVRDRRIRAFAGLRPDTGRSLIYPTSEAACRRRWPSWTISRKARSSSWATTSSTSTCPTCGLSVPICVY